MKSIFIIIIACFTVSSNNIDTLSKVDFKSCSAELIVENNKDYRPILDDNGATFSIELFNTSSEEATYKLSTKISKGLCDNASKNNFSKDDFDVDITFQSNSSKGLSKDKDKSKDEITLNGGESQKFLVTIKFPENTPYSNCRSIEVIAKSKDCENGSVKTTLTVFNPSPTDK